MKILEVRNDIGYTVLALAIKKCDYISSSYLLNIGANPNSRNNVKYFLSYYSLTQAINFHRFYRSLFT